MDAFLKILVTCDGGWLILVVVRDPVSCAQFATRGIVMKGPRWGPISGKNDRSKSHSWPSIQNCYLLYLRQSQLYRWLVILLRRPS
ncbi:MAG: hypothetical protein CM1200mP24_09580 [Gammaproteobacteria bacterium]|nr:MAG: hypothetical protein CM1200mP24_09580 [Gammaproteobacteria bacterium]